ncbi:hypothetical protein FOG48_01298 [Hanseniaspora uvarum]|nr:hypothetical protein FOG48_01298 [Hanseniaspora uvarum]
MTTRKSKRIINQNKNYNESGSDSDFSHHSDDQYEEEHGIHTKIPCYKGNIKNNNLYNDFIQTLDDEIHSDSVFFKNFNLETIKENKNEDLPLEVPTKNVLSEEEINKKIDELNTFVEQSKLYSNIIANQLNEDSTEKEWKYNIPELIGSDITIKNYQRQGFEWLLSLYINGLNGLLSDEMGLGKTLQILLLLCFIYENEQMKNNKTENIFLIVVPLTTLDNWVNEIKKFCPDLPYLKYYGKEIRDDFWKTSKRKAGLFSNNNRSGVLLTTYEIIMSDINAFKTLNHSLRYLIIDEGHRLKNLNCKLINCLNSLNLKHSNKILITGTPLQNNLIELWSLLNFIMPNIFSDYDEFNKWFDSTDIHQIDQKLISNLHVILKPFVLRRLKKDVLLNNEIPLKKEFLIKCSLDPRQRRLYSQLVKNTFHNYKNYFLIDSTALFMDLNRNLLKEYDNKTLILYLKYLYLKLNDFIEFDVISLIENYESYKELFENLDTDIYKKFVYLQIKSTINNNVQMQKRHIINNPFIIFNPYYHHDDYKEMTNNINYLKYQGNKLKKLDSLISLLLSKSKHKVLIFTQFITNIDLLIDYLQIQKIKYKVLTGTTTNLARQQDINEFQSTRSPYKVFLISTRAGGLGINLTKADSIILYDSDWNPSIDKQAIDRVHRIGQKNNVGVYRLFCGSSYEQSQFEKIHLKNHMNEVIVENGNFTYKNKLRDDFEEVKEDYYKYDFEFEEDENYDEFTSIEKTVLLDRSDLSYSKTYAEKYQNLPNVKLFNFNNE